MPDFVLKPYQAPKPIPQPVEREVKCIGPLHPLDDHRFMTYSRTPFGICHRCRDAIGRMSPRAGEEPVKFGPND